MPPRRKIPRDFVRMLILEVLQGGPLHGYGIIQSILRAHRGLYAPSPGAMYPALRWLSRRGYIVLHRDTRRRTYRITPAGRGVLGGLRDEARLRRPAFSVIASEQSALLRAWGGPAHPLRATLHPLTVARAGGLLASVARLRHRLHGALGPE